MNEIERAEAAERLLNDRAVQAAFEALQEDAAGVFLDMTKTPEDVEDARAQVRALKALHGKLRHWRDLPSTQKGQHRDGD